MKESGLANRQVSIIINTCNRVQDLKRCLDSLRAQTHKNFETIVIDNNSTDGTSNLLRQYSVKVVRNSTKKLSYLFNLGWHNASGDILAYIADDVEADPEWLENIIGTFNKFPKAAAVSGPIISTQKQEMHLLYEQARKSSSLRPLLWLYERVIMENKLFEPGRLCQSGAYSMGAGLPRSMNLKGPIEVDLLTTSSMGIRKKVLQELAGFDENFYFNHADGDLFVRLKKQGYRLIFNPEIKALHYARPGPSRFPYYMGRDTAYFFMKDIRPKSLSGWGCFLLNIIFFNGYWFYKAIQIRDIKQLNGFFGFLCGIFQYLRARIFKAKRGKV